MGDTKELEPLTLSGLRDLIDAEIDALGDAFIVEEGRTNQGGFTNGRYHLVRHFYFERTRIPPNGGFANSPVKMNVLRGEEICT